MPLVTGKPRTRNQLKKKTALILALLLPVQIVGLKFLADYPAFVEKWYSTGLYPFTSSLMRMGLGFIPFSLGDFLYALFVILILRWIFLRFKQKFRKPLQWTLEMVATISIVYFCFNLFWGINYYRLPLHQSLEIESEYTTEELQLLTETLVARSNEVHLSITGNDSAKVVIPYGKNELLDRTLEGYDQIQDVFPELEYQRVSLKRSLYSIPLSYMGFNGYLNPWTNEAQVNTVIMPFRIPTTASHEVGHQLGFAAENEANFIACLVTMNHPDAYFRYSGYTYALSHCLSELFRRDPEAADKLLKEINYGVRLNYQEVEDFWLAHENPFEPIFMYSYNNYLKANNQAAGMKSYSYVVALLVNYFKDSRSL